MARSDITAANFKTEMDADSNFAALSDGLKRELVNSAIQRIANFYCDAEKSAYRTDNLTGPAGTVTFGEVQCSFAAGVSNVAGYTHVFNVPFSAGLLIGDYKLDIQVYASEAGASMVTELGFRVVARDENGFTVIPDNNNAFIVWSATPFSSSPS